MSEQPWHKPLALAEISPDFQKSEQLCVSSFDVSARDWLWEADLCPDVEEFVKAFASYLETEKNRQIGWLDMKLEIYTRPQSEEEVILSRVASRLEAKKPSWLRVARGKAEGMLSLTQPMISASSHKVSGDSNARVSNRQHHKSDYVRRCLSHFIEDCRREGQEDLHALVSEPGRLLERHRHLTFCLGDVYRRAGVVVLMAKEEVKLRRQAEAPDLPLSKYAHSGQALTDLVHTEMEAVRPILEASFNAYRELGRELSFGDGWLWRFFEAETKFIFEYFPFLSHAIQELLKSEFRFMCSGPPAVPVDDVPPPPRLQIPASTDDRERDSSGDRSPRRKGTQHQNRIWFKRVQAKYLECHKKRLTYRMLSQKAEYETEACTDVKNWMNDAARSPNAAKTITEALKEIENELDKEIELFRQP